MDYFGDMHINWLTTVSLFLNCFVFLAGYFVGNLHLFGKETLGDIAIMLLNCLFLVFFYLNIQSVSIVVQGVSHLCKTMCQKPLITIDDIVHTLQTYTKIKPFLGFLAFMYYFCVQYMALISMYMFIIGQNILASALLSLGFVIYLAIFLCDLEVLYHHMDNLTDKAKADAFRTSKNIRQLLKMKDKIAELEDYRMVTGLGFYEVGQSLVTSFLSTTLTYLIVLVQSEPILNPKA